MAKDMFDVSDDAWGMPQEAVKEFTDREDPQEAFERKFRVLRENWKKSYYVLCYYGIGGIGKTCFVNKLCRVIRGVEGNELRLLDKIDCNYIRYDFGAEKSGTDKLSILLSFRKQLGEADKDFKFFRFDSAVLLYAKRSGVSIEKDETAKALLEGNPWLDAVLSTVGTVPGIGWVSGVIQAINKSAKTVRDSVSKHMDEARYRYHLNEIDSLEMPELLKKLHEYFILDMRYNMQQVATKPVIVFMDTYERYIDTLNREISMITEDYWLRKGNRSVIRSIPGILWVITGREKLYWAEDDAWGEPKAEGQLSQMSEEEKDALAETHLEQHLLGDLCQKDATGFLKKAGITNDALCIQLYKLTNGTPLFLDICVDTYYDLCSEGIPTEPEQFGEDLTQLISRYLSNMTNENREMTYFLACLGKWNNEDVQRIAKEATTLRWYTYAKYESFVEHSFIIKNPNGSYYMHETVRSAALKNADEEIVEEIGRIKLSVLQEKVEADQTLEDNETFAEYIKELAKKHLSYEEFCEHYLGVVFKKVISLLKVSKLDDFYIPAKELFSMVTNLYPGTKAEYIVRIAYGVTLNVAGYAKEALEVVSEVPLESSAVGVSGKGWREIKLQIAKIYFDNGMYQKSVDIGEKILEERKQLLGKEHPDTLRAMNELASFYSKNGEKKKALELFEQTLELKKCVLGKEHPDTLRVMFDLAWFYEENKEYGKAEELAEHTLELQKMILGEEHSDTIKSMLSLCNFYSKENIKKQELEEQTLEIMTRAYGKEHPLALTLMGNLACSYARNKENQKALELFEQTLELRRRVLGEEHPDTLSAMGYLAASYGENGDYRKGMELLEHTLELQKRILGEEHPDTWTTMGNLIFSYRENEEITKVLSLAEQLFELKKRVRGEEHPDTLLAMGILADSYRDNGEHRKAMELYEQTLELMRRVHGAEHPDTLQVMSSLIILCRENDEKTKALDFSEQLLELEKRVHGEEHPDTLLAMGNLANSYAENGEKEKALKLREQTLELMKRVLGEKHLNTLKAMGSLASSYGDNGEHRKALELNEQTLVLEKQVLGEDHPSTLGTMNNLALSYGKNGEKGKELELQEQTLEKMKRVLGEDHPNTLVAMNNLANSYGVSGKYKKAQELYEQIAEVKKRVLIEEHPENGKLESLVEEIEKMEILADVLEVYQARERSMQPVPPTPEERKVAELRALLEEQNNPTFQCELAARHLEGRGIELSAKKALELYRMAAEQGSCAALFCQAILHLQGRGTKQDEHAAFDLFEKAAEQNHANAQFMISMFYGTGRGVEKDEALAAQWYEKALQNGQLKKAYDINRLFLDCEDARSNLGLLVAWHEHTSYQEFPISRCNFGYMYETGRGVEADIERAKEWYEKAAGQGDAVAAKLLEDLKKPGLFGKLFGKPRKK